ncbi:unnamed protein product [Ceratitis capitata]|uniref:(Mediterranean fruit fly) hypothetical protein n=1 Tax=Ceratitis capitata TaxID=7213 RepID=A0A811VLZ2_CERCA|nr:unnamed protein product [Ceratitis capitata]
MRKLIITLINLTQLNQLLAAVNAITIAHTASSNTLTTTHCRGRRRLAARVVCTRVARIGARYFCQQSQCYAVPLLAVVNDDVSHALLLCAAIQLLFDRTRDGCARAHQTASRNSVISSAAQS